tara:strand:+ start:572 stop:970 length:399 start_codon:yes stop_codon:yes gene_type:complete
MTTLNETQTRRLFLRVCDYCSKGISVGYVWGNGEAYGCDGCYTEHLIRWTLDLADNHFFRDSDNKEEFIMDITDQLYVGWNEEDDYLDEYYDSKGQPVDPLPQDVIMYGQEVWDPVTQNYEWKEIEKSSIIE